MVHKLILIIYLITSFLKETPKNDQNISLCILTANSYFRPSFNISQRNVVPIFLNNKTI